jgi:hypothetical protein
MAAHSDNSKSVDSAGKKCEGVSGYCVHAVELLLLLRQLLMCSTTV